MDLRAVLLRATAARPRVLLVTMPGAARVRLAAERELRRRDLPEALTPAEANILLVAGPACASLEGAVGRLWRDVPAPRARAHARTADEVGAVLTSSRRSLAAAPAPRAGVGHGAKGAHHGTHGHGGMDMAAGPPMAERGEDRDGLALDRLHVTLGPFLADWPAGLTVHLTLQGDVIQQVDRVEPAPRDSVAGRSSYWSEPWMRAAAGEEVLLGEAARRRAAAHLDSLGRFLAVAGWPAQAAEARRLRDDLVAGTESAGFRPRAERFARRTGRSRTLSWLTRGMGELSWADAEAAGVSGPAARADGDVPARYRQWLTALLGDVARLDDRGLLDPAERQGPRGRLDGPRPPSAALAGVLPHLLAGAEVAAARLIVASLDPDPDELPSRLPGAARG